MTCGFLPAAEPGQPSVKHPNLLLNRKEIDEIKGKMRSQPWAAGLFEQVKAMAEEMVTRGARNEREAALCCVLTGDRRYSDAVRRLLLQYAREFETQRPKLDLKLQPEWGAWEAWGVHAWAYDLTYDTRPKNACPWRIGCARPAAS